MATDVKNDANLSTSLVSYWELEESSGTRVDSHGSNDLTDNNTVGSSTGKQGTAASFVRANSEYLSITDASQSGLDMTTDFSISAWVKLSSSPPNGGEMIIASKYQEVGSNRNYLFSYFNDGGTYKLSLLTNATGGAGGNLRTNVAQTLTTGTWYHIVMTYDLSLGTVEFFVNGTSIGTASGGAASLTNGGAEFQIGAESSNGSYFDGLIDELGIWTKILSSTEISDLYNSGSGIPYDAGGAGATFTPKIIFYG